MKIPIVVFMVILLINKKKLWFQLYVCGILTQTINIYLKNNFLNSNKNLYVNNVVPFDTKKRNYVFRKCRHR